MSTTRTSFDTSKVFGAEVVIDGLDAVLNGLEEVDPKLRKGLERELKTTVGTVAQAASRQVRSRTGETAAGYRVTQRSGVYKVANRTRGGAILEFAAVPHTPRGETLINTLNEVYGKPGRILWESWDVVSPFVVDRITRLVEDAEFDLERLMS